MNLWHFRRQSTLNVSQTWLQSNEYCAHVRGKIKYILTEMGCLHAPKIFCLIKTCALISHSLFHSDELIVTFSTLNASQTWLQSTDYWAHIRVKIIQIVTETGHLYVNITFCLISICPLTFTDLQCIVERVRFSAAVNVQNSSEHCVELLTFQLVGLFNTRCRSNMTSFNRLLQLRLYYSAYSVTYDDVMIVCFYPRG